MDSSRVVVEFLAAHPKVFFCNACIGRGTRLFSMQEVVRLTTPLRAMKPYRSGKVMCHRCGLERNCIAFG